MKVRELAQWLAAFEDQDATVEVVSHASGTSCYEQGGVAETVTFNPGEHAEYVDLRGNKFVKPDAQYYNARTLLLGKING